MYSRGDGYGDRPRHQFVLWSCMGVVGVSVCLSGAAIRGGRGGAARLSYRVCSPARPPARPPAGLGHAGCYRWGMCLSLLPWLVETHPDPLYNPWSSWKPNEIHGFPWNPCTS